MAKTMPVGLELILPVVIGLILLVLLLVLYCYFCVIKRQGRSGDKMSSAKAIKKDNLSSTITIVPSSPQNVSQSLSSSYVDCDPHHIGVPVSNYGYEDDTKKRYSLVNQQEQQLIEELKQQQLYQQQQHHGGGVSVISNGTINRNQPILSPYNSWSASQLLHEHERRRSPMDGHLVEQQEQELVHGEHMDQMLEHYPPPVPPLPMFNDNVYPINYDVYGGVGHQPGIPQEHAIYQSMHRRGEQFNNSIQGSVSSVNSGEKKRRNVTMV